MPFSFRRVVFPKRFGLIGVHSVRVPLKGAKSMNVERSIELKQAARMTPKRGQPSARQRISVLKVELRQPQGSERHVLPRLAQDPKPILKENLQGLVQGKKWLFPAIDIREGFRGQGVGSYLIKYAESVGKQLKVDMLIGGFTTLKEFAQPFVQKKSLTLVSDWMAATNPDQMEGQRTQVLSWLGHHLKPTQSTQDFFEKLVHEKRRRNVVEGLLNRANWQRHATNPRIWFKELR